MKKTSFSTRALVEGAMMIALATVLSLFKLIEMPYGGSVTVASALPMIIFAYRHGTVYGLFAGTVYAVIQQLLGLNMLSYVTGWQSVVAVIMLDYILAFVVVGLGGLFSKMKVQKNALLFAALTVTLLRYVCHVVSGFTVWRDISIPAEAAFVYSLGYNLTYMLPEGIILSAAAYYVGSAVDFKRSVPARITAANSGEPVSANALIAGAVVLLAVVLDVYFIAPCLQDGDSGKFIISGLAEVNWIAVGIVSALAAAVAVILFALRKRENRQ